MEKPQFSLEAIPTPFLLWVKKMEFIRKFVPRWCAIADGTVKPDKTVKK